MTQALQVQPHTRTTTGPLWPHDCGSPEPVGICGALRSCHVHAGVDCGCEPPDRIDDETGWGCF